MITKVCKINITTVRVKTVVFIIFTSKNYLQYYFGSFTATHNITSWHKLNSIVLQYNISLIHYVSQLSASYFLSLQFYLNVLTLTILSLYLYYTCLPSTSCLVFWLFNTVSFLFYITRVCFLRFFKHGFDLHFSST